MLTKNDLQKIKQAIQEVAVTKKDAKSFATKKDLIGLAKGSEIDELKITFLDNLAKWKDELYRKIDPILGRVKTAEEENTILQAREEARREVFEKFGARISKLEQTPSSA